MTELVVLLDEAGQPSGTAEKASVHTSETPLHLAFSCHVFNEAGEILVTRRALIKKTWPGVWTNSFCGHPAPGEEMSDAVERRAADELGLEIKDLTLALPDFQYRAVDASGVVENEVCPVYAATAVSQPNLNPDEVAEYYWANPAELLKSVTHTPFAFSPWLTLQLPRLAAAGFVN